VQAIEINGLSKRFGATQALDDVSFSIKPGEVRALIGENGAGKSTIVKILSGLVVPSSGTITVFGLTSARTSPRSAAALGIQTAFQEMTLLPDLTVTQNLLIPHEPARLGFVSRAASRRKAADILDDLGLGHIDPDARPPDFDLATRQKIEIAKAVSRKPKILLLDEPTSALSVEDVDWLAALVERLSAEAVTTLFVSHRMHEVRRFCSSMTLLRNGRHVGTYDATEISDEEVVEHVIGRSVSSVYPVKAPSPIAQTPVMLSARSLSASSALSDVSFDLRRGEVLGIAGLQGMGQLELFRALFGVIPLTSGTLAVDGNVPLILNSPADAIRVGIDMGLVPEDRAAEGLALERPALETASMPVLARLSRFGHIDRKREAALLDEAFARLQVPPRARYMPGRSFSGGNQQKIVISKWLVARSRILLMFDPTRGIDIGAKHQIYTIISELAAEGRSILLHSTETSELANLCDRVIVFYQGRIAVTLEGAQISESAIVAAALGSTKRLAS
jgi:ribose transport system ATP-binding protein